MMTSWRLFHPSALTGRPSWETRWQPEMAIFKYINGFYNPRHRHSALGWKSPVAFERKVA
jgi:putative transposase